MRTYQGQNPEDRKVHTSKPWISKRKFCELPDSVEVHIIDDDSEDDYYGAEDDGYYDEDYNDYYGEDYDDYYGEDVDDDGRHLV